MRLSSFVPDFNFILKIVESDLKIIPANANEEICLRPRKPETIENKSGTKGARHMPYRKNDRRVCEKKENQWFQEVAHSNE